MCRIHGVEQFRDQMPSASSMHRSLRLVSDWPLAQSPHSIDGISLSSGRPISLRSILSRELGGGPSPAWSRVDVFVGGTTDNAVSNWEVRGSLHQSQRGSVGRLHEEGGRPFTKSKGGHLDAVIDAESFHGIHSRCSTVLNRRPCCETIPHAPGFLIMQSRVSCRRDRH
jgi:hypothetical protein